MQTKVKLNLGVYKMEARQESYTSAALLCVSQAQILFYCCMRSQARLMTLGTVASNGCLVSALDDAGRNVTGGKNLMFRETATPVPFCLPEIKTGLTWN